MATQVNEIEFLGVTLLSRLNGSCQPIVTVAPIPAPDRVSASVFNVSTAVTPAVSPSAFQYGMTATPVITSVSPKFGSSLGGTTVTITGTGFGTATAVADTAVDINGVACAVVSVSDSEVTCVTGARPPPPDIPPVSFGVTIAQRGRALQPAAPYWFRYLDRFVSVSLASCPSSDTQHTVPPFYLPTRCGCDAVCAGGQTFARGSTVKALLRTISLLFRPHKPCCWMSLRRRC